MFKCRDVPDHATDYLEGTLDRRRWLELRMHLLICRMCRTYTDQMRKTKQLLHTRQMPPPPPETETHLVTLASTQARD